MPTSRTVGVRAITLMLMAALWMIPPAALANFTSEPVFNPELSIQKTPKEIKIDGDLNDAGWSGATHIMNFVERHPGDNTAPEVATKAMITYDEDHLYVAFVCVDDPSAIRATMCERDRFYNDDAVCVMIDTYGDASWAYEFFVNPYGVQKDNLWSSVAGEDSGFDLIWNSAAKITEAGYQVEMALPFSSLRFPNQSMQSWKMDFWRNRPRESFHQYSWAAYDRNEQCWPCQWGTVSGIGDVKPGKGFEVLPTFVAFQSSSLHDASDPHSGLRDGDVMGEPSIGGKYALSSDVTFEAAWNPDFSQIESDAAQVDVNTSIALFYPERRPFFQEGADVFRTLFNSFYTRTVNDPEYAVKLVSRKPGLTLGFMSAQDESTPYLIPLDESSILRNTGRSYVNALRATKPVGEGSQIGFIATDRRLDGGGYGSILALDGNVRLAQSYAIDGQFISSFTGEPDKAGATEGLEGLAIDEGAHSAVFDGESYSGNAFIARFKHFARHWSFMIDYNQVDPSYRTLTGYDPWVNYRQGSVWTGYTFYPESGLFQRIQPQVYAENRWMYDGTRRWERQNFSIDNQLRWAQTHVNIYVSRGSQAWTNGVTGEFTEYDDLYDFGFSTYSRFNDRIGYSLSYERGRSVARFADAIGTENSFFIDVDIKPFDRLLIEPNFNFVRSTHADTKKELFRQSITRTRFRYQVNKELSVRLVVQYNDAKASIHISDGDLGPNYYQWSEKAWDVDPLITYRLSPFSVLYAGSTQDYMYFPENDVRSSVWKLSSRQFFVKIQHLFQV